MNTRDHRDAGARGPGEQDDLRAAAERLEAAVDDFARSATGAVSGRATRVVDDLERAARRLRRQVDDPREPRAGRHRGRRHEPVDDDPMLEPWDGVRASRSNGWLRDLWREPHRGWIAGICAGLARYYGVERWVVRLVAFTLLIFVPQIAFWAYVIGIFMLGKRPRQDAPTRWAPPAEDRSPAPELGPRLAPRRNMQGLRLRYRELESRLRRLEGHVTSREFTLAREFSELERREQRGAP